MPGGLMSIQAFGQENVILTSNPQKTFFKSVYKRYSNFGMQKFRLDFEGQRNLRLTEDSHFKFKVPRYADLLMDTYLVVNLPTIWSPIFPPNCSNNNPDWIEYGFKWIKNLGSQLIREIKISVGGQILGVFTGQYLYNIVERDFDKVKKELYYKMTGNVVELNDPANANGNFEQYPNVYYTAAQQGPEPSIRARKLYIPINAWFSLNSKMAFPLVALQYNELQIDVILRPIQEICVIKDVSQPAFPAYVQPNFNDPNHGFYRFLQPPPSVALDTADYLDKRTNWNADIHIIANYAFLSEEEQQVFAGETQEYLIKEMHEFKFNNISGAKKVNLETFGMVADWMWYFQRNDAYLRNEWSNYTNWPYDTIPYPLIDPEGATAQASGFTDVSLNNCAGDATILPNKNGDDTNTGYLITPLYNTQNAKDILLEFGIVLGGEYRENIMDAGVYNYIEKYTRTSGNSSDGLYCYNYGVNTNIHELQPSGAMNLSRFSDKNIELEFSTITPTLDPSASFYTICDPITGTNIGVNKASWQIYDYTYDMVVYEERYNVVQFISGNAGLKWAR